MAAFAGTHVRAGFACAAHCLELLFPNTQVTQLGLLGISEFLQTGREIGARGIKGAKKICKTKLSWQRVGASVK